MTQTDNKIGHTELPFVNGWGEGLTGPTTPIRGGICCGGDNWKYVPISKDQETIAIVVQQDGKDGLGKMKANAQFLCLAANNHYKLVDTCEALMAMLVAYREAYGEYLNSADLYTTAEQVAKQVLKAATGGDR